MENKKDDIKQAINNIQDPMLQGVMSRFYSTIAERGFSEPEPEVTQDPVEYALRQLEGLGVPTKEAIVVMRRRIDDTPCILAAREWKTSTLDVLNDVQLGRCEAPFLNIVLFGLNGRGKSVAAAWLLSQVDTKDIRKIDTFPMWIRADDYIRLTLSDFEDDKNRVRRMATAKVLVIDELGGETIGDSRYAADALSRLVVARDAAMRPTIITSNLPKSASKGQSVERCFLQEVKARYDGRVVSRMIGDAMLVEAQGPDLRARRWSSPGSSGAPAIPMQPAI